MSAVRSRIAVPGPGRLTLLALVVIPAVLAYPWRTGYDRWLLAIAVVLTVVLLAWRRGRHLTSLAAGRIALLLRRGRPLGAQPERGTDVHTAVALRVVPGSGAPIPVPLLAGYLDRYGVRAESVRLTSRDTPAGRTTWLSLTFSAAANLVALQARSPEVPLRDTAETAVRRLADHLRELGWAVSITDLAVPDLLGPAPRELWRTIEDGTAGTLTAYAVAVDGDLDRTLADVRAYPSPEVWTSLEITGTRQRPRLAAATAIRSADQSPADLPDTLVAQDGAQLAAVRALHPLSTTSLVAQPVEIVGIPELGWPASAVAERAG